MSFDKTKLLKFKKTLTIDNIYKIFPEIQIVNFEKYVRPTLNFINSRLTTSQTDKRHVGQLSNLFQNYLSSLESGEQPSKDGWKQWYLNCKNVFEGVSSIDKSVVENKVRTGQQAFDQAIKNIENLVKFLSKEIINNRLTNQIIKRWVDDLMFTKTFQGFCIEKPIVNFVCKLLFKENDNVDSYNPKKLRKSTPSEESKGIDYVYKDGNLILNFQVKSGVADAEYLRKTSHAISQLPDDVYCLHYIKKDNGTLKLTVKYNDKIILEI